MGGMKMEKKVFIIDISKCTGCFNCFIACKDEFTDHSWPPYSAAQPETDHHWVKVNEVERGQFPKVKLSFIPEPCQHCEDPRCLKAAQDGAVYKRKDGLVIIDPVKGKGQKQIGEACPYHRIYWNKELGIPQKCTGCAHLMDDGWKVPRCVEACPTEALLFGDKERLSKLIEQAGQLHPEYGTNPSAYYIGLPKAFVAGSIYMSESRECLENARVALINQSSKAPVTTRTDNYGEFEFEGLEVNTICSIRIEADGYYPVSIDDINIRGSVTLEDIFLQKKI
jgi:Fe-S-cluster-containing dehydrogenase component